MVDAAQVDADHRLRRRSLAGPAAGLRFDAVALTADTIARYGRVAETFPHAPAQSLRWLSAWSEAAGADGVILTVRDGDRPLLGLALEVVSRGPCRVARFVGGTHANGNFPPVDPQRAREIGADALRDLAASLKASRRDIDLIALERLLPDHEGLANPFMALPHRDSPDPSLAVDLAGGFEAVLGRANPKKKRKRRRSQQRKLELVGAIRRYEADTTQDVRDVLDAFFAMKHARLLKAGITDVFDDSAIRDSFRKLFTEALGATPKPFVLHALEVGGIIRAVTGSSRCGDRLICEFGAIADDDLTHASPGDFLFYDNIREACSDGMAVYDFSVGDEHYKRQWCSIETRCKDVLLPLTAKGRLLAGGLHLSSAVKAAVKRNPRLWEAAKAFRRRIAGTTVEPDPDA